MFDRTKAADAGIFWVNIMIATISLSSFAGGTLLACFADRFPEKVSQIETIAGILLIFGLASVGSGFAAYSA